MMQETSIPNATPNIRLSLPSKGRLIEDTMSFLSACGLSVFKPNPRQYQATISSLPDVLVLFQRPADIVVSVRDGSVDFGITGLDVVEEHKGTENQVLIMHEALGFGHCALTLAVPESWDTVTDINSLRSYVENLQRPVRIATKYPNLTSRFMQNLGIPFSLISAEGTLETIPAIGYADMIADLVSSGQTLRDNRLRPLADGVILRSQAVLIANINALNKNPQVLATARYLLEYFDAHLRARDNLAIFANIRGDSPEAIAQQIFEQPTIRGLQGPTISKIIVQQNEQNWFAVNIIVKRSELYKAIAELRAIGGSGVVVLPVTYIFEEESPRYIALLNAVKQ